MRATPTHKGRLKQTAQNHTRQIYITANTKSIESKDENCGSHPYKAYSKNLLPSVEGVDVRPLFTSWTATKMNPKIKNSCASKLTLMSIKFALLDVAGALSIPGSAVASFRNNAWNTTQHRTTTQRDTKQGGKTGGEDDSLTRM